MEKERVVKIPEERARKLSILVGELLEDMESDNGGWMNTSTKEYDYYTALQAFDLILNPTTNDWVASKDLSLFDILKRDNWEDILTSPPFNFEVKRDNGYVMIKYRMGNTDLSLKAVADARGIILEEKTLEPVCIPYKKFFNKEEPLAAKLIGNHFIIEEKKDGSLIKVWKHRGIMNVSTNGSIDAYKADFPNHPNLTFGEVFDRSIKRLGPLRELLEEYTKEGYTHMFELCTPMNRIVVEHKEEDLFYLGSTNPLGDWYKDAVLDKSFKSTKTFVVTSNDLDSTVDTIIKDYLPNDTEGVVVSDFYGNKIKIKTQEYIDKHYFYQFTSKSDRGLALVVLKNEQDEVLSVRPDLKERMEEQEKRIKEVEQKITARVNGLIENYSSRKDMFKALSKLDITEAEKSLTRYALSVTLSNVRNELPILSPTLSTIKNIEEMENESK